MHHALLTLLTAGALSLPTLVTAAVGSSAAAAPPTCQGQAATLVGDGRGVVQGTDGPDVIVSNGSDVRAHGGDDLICLTNAGKRDFAYVYADSSAAERRAGYPGSVDGDDTVLVQTGYGRVRAFLGDGDDTYRGGAGADDVVSELEQEPQANGGSDDVRTGGGRDDVVLGGSSGPGAGVVALGSGDDVFGKVGAEPVRLDGGPGVDNLRGVARAGAVRIDARARRVVVDGVLAHQGYRSMEGYFFPVRDSTTFEGTAGPDVLTLQGGRVRADLRGGDDTLEVIGYRPGLVRGGSGHDLVRTSARDRARIDLQRGVVLVRSKKVGTQVRGFRDATVQAAGSVVTGDALANRLRLIGCSTAHGGPGRDSITVLSRLGQVDDGCRRDDRRARVLGGGGDDRLVGSLRADVLVGERGRDVAVGNGGRDVCRAETRRRC